MLYMTRAMTTRPADIMKYELSCRLKRSTDRVVLTTREAQVSTKRVIFVLYFIINDTQNP